MEEHKMRFSVKALRMLRKEKLTLEKWGDTIQEPDKIARVAEIGFQVRQEKEMDRYFQQHALVSVFCLWLNTQLPKGKRVKPSNFIKPPTQHDQERPLDLSKKIRAAFSMLGAETK